MALAARQSWRDLAPVEENVPFQDNASQTLLGRVAVCPRSGFLYIRHRGGPGSHEMHRGSAFHEFARQATLLLIEQGEAQLPWDLGKDMIASIVAGHPGWVIPPAEMDVLRTAVYHWCECTVIDPASVVAVEKLFELPIGRFRVRGKVDLLLAVEGGMAVRDYKTQAAVPSQDDFDSGIQTPLYSLLVAEGYPVRQEACGDCVNGLRMTGAKAQTQTESGEWLTRDLRCPKCGGSGRIEVPEPSVGARAGLFDVAEVYPRPEPWETASGAKELAWRGNVLTRHELVDHRLYSEGLLAKLEHGFETGEWPAVPGSHCSTCPASYECPLPAKLRSRAGEINDLEQAQEAAEKLVFDQRDVAARQAELRNWAKAHDQLIRVGSDEAFDFVVRESEEWITGKKIGRPTTADAREQMQDALRRSVQFGEPFRFDEFRRTRRSSNFVKRKLSIEEIAALDAPAEVPADERWGVEAPF